MAVQLSPPPPHWPPSPPAARYCARAACQRATPLKWAHRLAGEGAARRAAQTSLPRAGNTAHPPSTLWPPSHAAHRIPISSQTPPHHSHNNRMDCAYHSVTAMVGAGVLGLPGVMSTLGWAGGLLALAASLFVSWCAKASAEGQGQGGGQGTRSARRRAVSPRRPSLWIEQRATRGGAPCTRTNTPNAPEHAITRP